MVSIRKYIDLVEGKTTVVPNLNEDLPFGWLKKKEQPAFDLDKRINGRREIPSIAAPREVKFNQQPKLPPREPTDPEMKAELERVRTFKSAYDYAHDPSVNQYIQTDHSSPPQVKRLADAEAARLAAHWTYYHEQGYV